MRSVKQTDLDRAYAMGRAYALGRVFTLGMAYGLGKLYARRGLVAWDAKEGKVRWITVRGARVPVGENGELQGAVGAKIEAESGKSAGQKEKRAPARPRRDLAKSTFQKPPQTYLKDANGNLRKAITDCFRNELLGGYVKRKLEVNGQQVDAEIAFTNRTLHEFKKYTNENTLLALPKVAEIITSGTYAGRTPEPNHLPEVAFHTMMKHVDVGRIRKLVAVDVGESSKGDFYAYSVNQVGQSSFVAKKERFTVGMKQRRGKSRDGQIEPVRLEVIGLRFLG